MKRTKSSQIAMGGVFSSLCLLIMLISSVIPLSTYIAPALAGVMIAVVVFENGRKIAFMVYISVSLLSIFMVSDYEVKVLFISLFGYYPILKVKIDKLSGRLIKFIIKLFIFSVSVIGSYFFLINILGLEYLKDELSNSLFMVILFIIGFITFIIYDFSLLKYIYLYEHKFRKLIIKE